MRNKFFESDILLDVRRSDFQPVGVQPVGVLPVPTGSCLHPLISSIAMKDASESVRIGLTHSV